MLKAKQSALFNQANIDIIGIRTAEINYFSQFFSSFGTQAALMAGFIISSVTQVPGLDAECAEFWVYLYWITCAITFVASMHVLISTVFISTYGQGLALRGPVGSMVKAVDGMVIEQNTIVIAFAVTIVSLAVNLIATFFIMMNNEGAIASSILVGIGIVLWYQYTLKIYNIFKIPTVNAADWDPNGSVSRSSSRLSIDANEFANLLGMEGYLSFKDGKTNKFSRYYFVLSSGYLNYYQDQKQYQLFPKKTLNRRHISFHGYQVEDEITEGYFALYLHPNDAEDNHKKWEFRADTVDEMRSWKNAMSQAIIASNTGAVQNKPPPSGASIFSGDSK